MMNTKLLHIATTRSGIMLFIPKAASTYGRRTPAARAHQQPAFDAAYSHRRCQVHLRAGHTDAALQLIGKLLEGSEVTHERWTNADLWRLRADALLVSGGKNAAAEAEVCYARAMSIAVDQGSRLLHLRVATSLARLTAEAGQRARACELLEPIFELFAEGFDKPDLRDAKALLINLH